MKHRIFVYGTLRLGMYNYDLYLRDEDSFRSYAYIKGSLMTILTKVYPAYLTEGHHMILGEIHEVDEETLKKIDKMEGYKGYNCIDNEYNKEICPIYDDQGHEIEKLPVYVYNMDNEDNVLSLGLKIGDIVAIHKAGDVIPEVIRALPERRTGKEKDFVMIKTCPICKSALVKKEGTVDYFCVNDDCPKRNIELLIHFASKNAMNIDGLGDRIIEDLYNMKYVLNIDDFYHLEKHKDDLKLLEGYGEKSVENLLNSIENSKHNSLERLLFGLGIPNVGSKTAKILAKRFGNIDNLIEADKDTLTNIKDIGSIIASSIIDYFSKNLELIKKLKELNINMNYLGEKEIFNENITNKKFVITGTIEGIPRDEIKLFIENNGGTVTGSVSKNTDAVIVGTDPGSKYDKALALNIKIINEEEIKQIMGK